MDYLAYYKLALEKVYGGEFPEMSSEEFDRRCALETVPAALKALYLALGTERICAMHTLLPIPEELFCVENMVLVQRVIPCCRLSAEPAPPEILLQDAFAHCLLLLAVIY